MDTLHNKPKLFETKRIKLNLSCTHHRSPKSFYAFDPLPTLDIKLNISIKSLKYRAVTNTNLFGNRYLHAMQIRSKVSDTDGGAPARVLALNSAPALTLPSLILTDIKALIELISSKNQRQIVWKSTLRCGTWRVVRSRFLRSLFKWMTAQMLTLNF